MSRLQEYNPDFGIVFDLYDDWLNGIGNPGGTGGGGTKPPVAPPTFAQQSLNDKTAVQAANGGMSALPARAFEYAPGRAYYQPAGSMAGSVLQKDQATGLWHNTGYSVSAADRPAVIAGIQREVAAGRWNAAPGSTPNTPRAPTNLSSGLINSTNAWANAIQNNGYVPNPPAPGANSPFSGLAGAPGTLGPTSGPILPGFGAYNQPGIGIPAEGRQTINGISTGLNTLAGGRQGSAVQIPVTPGFRGPNENGNSIQFAAGASGGGRVEPQMVFAPTSISVPGTYVYGQGNTGAANAAYQVPFNIGPGGASLANIAGNNVQIQSADKGTGYGYAINAMPASSVFAATGRDPSNDPASQAAQALMLNTALNQFGGGAGALQVLTAANANQFGGYHAGTGNDPFSGNGGSAQGTYFAGYDPFAGYGDSWGGGGGYDAGMRAATGGTFIVDPFRPMMRMAGGGGVAVRPLPGMSGGPHQLVTNEPMVLVGTQSHMVRGLVGEDNADPGTAPNRELLNFHNNSMHVTPLEPPHFATGGTITNLAPGETGRPSSNQYSMSYGTPTIPNQPGVTSAASGATDPTQGGFTGGGYVPGGQGGNGNFGNTPPTTPDPTDPNLPPETLPPAIVPPTPPVPGSSPLPTVIPSLDPLDPTILQPWQTALNTLDQQQALRNLYQYRRQAGGLGRELGRTVLSGDMPAGDAGPGAYWDMRPQVETAVNNILGAQNAFKQLGPMEDITPVQARASYLGNALDDMQKIRDLEIAKAAADSGVSLTQQGNNDLHVALETAQAALQSLMASGATQAQIAAQQAIINDLTQQVNAIGGGYLIASPSSSAGQAAKIQAQIDALKARLPANANESDLRTELALLNDRIGKNQKRIDLTQQVANLQKAGVPSLSAPIVPIDPFRAAA